ESKPKTSKKQEEYTASVSSAEEEEEEPPSEPERKPKTSKKQEEYTASASSAEEEEEKTLPKSAQKRKIGKFKIHSYNPKFRKLSTRARMKKMAPKITSREFKSQSTSSEKEIASLIPGTSYQFTSIQQNIPGHKKGGVKTKKTPKIKTSRKVKEIK
ncbi:hypothetical protein H311_05047, partial [Anncaliia algerae PRA109]